MIAPLLPAADSGTGERGDSLEADGSAISEVLNMAWAAHEITDEYLSQVVLHYTSPL